MQVEKLTFEDDIHNMFSHLWDYEIDHPIFSDTVGELMTAVIQCYHKHFYDCYEWILCSDRNPIIDMTYPHSDDYLVKYESGGYDIAHYSNYNRFWVHEITDPYWICAPYCKVAAWMPIPGRDDEGKIHN